jgi:hypothetical protein
MDDSYNKLLYELFINGFCCGSGCFICFGCFFTLTISTSSALSESDDDAS